MGRLLHGIVLLAAIGSLCRSQSLPKKPAAGRPKVLHKAIRHGTERQAGLSLFESTFRFLQLHGNQGQGSLGTVLLITAGKGKNLQVVAVTTKHVLEAFKGDYARIELRTRDTWGTEVLAPCEVKVREHGLALYSVHPTADVAAFRIDLPDHAAINNLASLNWLATEEDLLEMGLQTGDVVYKLGFPLGVAADRIGYPILRSGVLASYPVLPLGSQQILADIPVFEGDSGGPVYVIDSRRHITHLNEHPWIFGLVSAGLSSTLTPRPEPLGLSVVVPASAVRDAINLLPRSASPSVCRVLSR